MQHGMECFARLVRVLLGNTAAAADKLEFGDALCILGVDICPMNAGFVFRPAAVKVRTHRCGQFVCQLNPCSFAGRALASNDCRNTKEPETQRWLCLQVGGQALLGLLEPLQEIWEGNVEAARIYGTQALHVIVFVTGPCSTKRAGEMERSASSSSERWNGGKKCSSSN